MLKIGKYGDILKLEEYTITYEVRKGIVIDIKEVDYPSNKKCKSFTVIKDNGQITSLIVADTEKIEVIGNDIKLADKLKDIYYKFDAILNELRIKYEI